MDRTSKYFFFSFFHITNRNWIDFSSTSIVDLDFCFIRFQQTWNLCNESMIYIAWKNLIKYSISSVYVCVCGLVQYFASFVYNVFIFISLSLLYIYCTFICVSRFIFADIDCFVWFLLFSFFSVLNECERWHDSIDSWQMIFSVKMEFCFFLFRNKHDRVCAE